ncbi:MAG: uroporphyrinogen decarboxylase family protein [Anaerolineae bacterium]
MEMTGRERLLAALNHREGDRVPIAFGGPEASIHRDAHRRLLEHLGLPEAGDPPIMDRILQIVEPDERLYEAFDVDALFLVPAEGPVQWQEGGDEYVDELGRRFRAGGGFYNQVASPLADGGVEELRRYRFPDLNQGDRAAGLAAKAQRWRDAGYGLAGDGAWGIYEVSSSLRGTADLFVDMALRPEYVEELAERVLEEHIKPFYTMLLYEVGPWVDMVVVSDDLGDQENLLFSPRFYRQVYKPRLRRLVEHVKGLADVKVYIHSDGAVSELIPDFIEAGIDGLNPVQYTARGMEAERLKREYGRDLGFFGGGIENEVLSYGSVADVRQHVQSQVSALKPGGGYLFATIHNISPEVPAENVVAFFAAGRESGRYR